MSLATEMKISVMNSVGRLDIDTAPMPVIKEDDVLVRLEYVGVCGSDAHLFENGFVGESQVIYPMTLGHEPGGVVAAVGSKVTRLKVGDRVAVEPGIPCRTCEFCSSGRYNLCEDVYFYASLPVTEGCFVEYIAHPASLCFKLPENVSTLEGALMEPLAVGFHAVKQSGIVFGSSAVILGCGCIGLVTLLSLKAFGIENIIVVDVMQNRLEKALELGATKIINASDCNPVETLRELTGGGADYCFETAGNPKTMFQAAKMTKRGGTITLVGYTSLGTAEMDVNHIIDNEMTIKTVFRYRNIYPIIIDAVSKGKINIKSIVTDIVPFDDIQSGMETFINNKDSSIKTVIKI